MFIFFLLFCQILVQVTKIECKFPAIIVFGDSTVDAGNNNFITTIARSDFYPYGRDFIGGYPTGRFCNGRLPSDFISEALGLKPTVPAYLDPKYHISDFSVGVCFASAGTGYDNATSDVLNVIPLWKEVEYYKEYQRKLKSYLGDEKAMETISEALYLVIIGTNDFLINYFTLPARKIQYNVEQYEDFLITLAENFLEKIYRIGARKIALVGLPPLGCLPLVRAINIRDHRPRRRVHHHHQCVEEYNNVALDFNGKLKGSIEKMNMKFDSIEIVFIDIYYILLQIITKPSLYGFEEGEYGCCGTGRYELAFLCNEHAYTCPDANKFVFWDAVHPTQKTYKVLADYLVDNYIPKFL